MRPYVYIFHFLLSLLASTRCYSYDFSEVKSGVRLDDKMSEILVVPTTNMKVVQDVLTLDPVNKTELSTTIANAPGAMYVHANLRTPQFKSKKNICLVVVTPEKPSFYKEIHDFTGLSFEIVDAIVIEHEKSHCIIGEHLDKEMQFRSDMGFFNTSHVVWFPKPMQAGLLSKNMAEISTTIKNMDTRQKQIWLENMADVLSVDYLLQKGVLSVNDVLALAKYRSRNVDNDPMHATGDSLKRLAALWSQSSKSSVHQLTSPSLKGDTRYTLLSYVVSSDK